jgi:hypothetical protein
VMTPNDIVRSLAMLDWAKCYSDGLDWDDQLCALIAKQGTLERLNYAIGTGAIWGTQTLTSAAGNGHLEMLMYLRMHAGESCPWTPATCAAAAAGGHLEVLKFLRRRPRGGGDVAPGGDVCSWDESTCVAAAKNGHLDVLKWARRHGCPWSAETWRAAAGNGHRHVLEWACAQVPPCPTAVDEDGPWNDEDNDTLEYDLLYENSLVLAVDGAPCPPMQIDDDVLSERSDSENEWSTVSTPHSSEYGDIDE